MKEFKELYQLYGRDIYRFMCRLTYGNHDLAEELTQETFYQAFLSLSRYRGECDIRTWLCQIGKNTCYKYFRKNPVHFSLDDREYEESRTVCREESPEALYERKEQSQQLYQSIWRLNKRYRDVLLYRVYFDFTFEQIGKMLHMNPGSAKVIYYRGKEMLKKEWKRKEE